MKIRTAVLTVSDRSSAGKRPDRSGPALEKAVSDQGWACLSLVVVPDDQRQIREQLIAWSDGTWDDGQSIDLILTTGGTGFAPRDVTPEATRAVIDRPAPGLAEAMRSASLEITPHAMLSRAEAGIRGHTLIVNLPGSPKAVLENFQVIAPVLPHAVELLREEQQAEDSHRALDH